MHAKTAIDLTGKVAKTFALNLFGAANAAFLAMRSMRRTGGGKIINVRARVHEHRYLTRRKSRATPLAPRRTYNQGSM